MSSLSAPSGSFKAGGATANWEHWKEIISDPFILDLVKGISVELTGVPHQPSLLDSSILNNPTKNNILRSKIREMESQGIIEKVPSLTTRSFCSRLFLLEKKDGDWRPILDLKPLNEFVKTRHFKMEHLGEVLPLVSKGAWMGSVDISQAYHSLSIKEKDRNFFMFKFEGSLYRYTCLAMGYSAAPRLFTLIMRQVAAYLRNSFGIVLSFYIDDTIILGDSAQEAWFGIRKVAETLDFLGFVVNTRKSNFIPTNRLRYLGMIIDSNSLMVELPDDKAMKLIDLSRFVLSKEKIKIRSVLNLLGQMTATSSANKWAFTYSKFLQLDSIRALRENRKNFEAKFFLSPEAKADIAFWINNIRGTSLSFCRKSHDLVIYTDSSTTGFGFFCQELGLQYGEAWDLEPLPHINQLEVRAVTKTLEHLGQKVFGKHLRLGIDSKTAISCLKKGGSTSSYNLTKETRGLLEFCLDKGISLETFYVPSAENIKADEASRFFRGSCEWSLNPSVFEELCLIWGKPEIDLFASPTNKKCDKFVSFYFHSDAFHQDAFSMNWTNTNIYLFPPFSCVSRCLTKLRQEKPSRCILLVPRWPTQPWWPLLQSLAPKAQREIEVSQDTLAQRKTRFPLAGQMKLLATLL